MITLRKVRAAFLQRLSVRDLATRGNICRVLAIVPFFLLPIAGCGSDSSDSVADGGGRRIENKIVYVTLFESDGGGTTGAGGGGNRFNTASTQVYAVRPDGTGHERLIESPERVVDAAPTLSSDGSKLAFLSSRDDCGVGCRRDRDDNPSPLQVWVANADGSQMKRLTSLEPDTQVSMVSFSPDGSKVLYTGLDGIWSVDSDGSEPVLVAEGNFFRNASFSPDGSKIIYERQQFDGTGVYTMNPDGSGEALLASDAYHAAFSPDGMRIAYVRGVVDAPSGIWMANADGSGATQLTGGPNRYYYPSFSPDGTRIVCQSRSFSGSDRLFVLNIDGTSEAQVPLPEVSADNFSGERSKLLSPYAWR
ncbi:MAG: PD40 domain-containing protein [Fibrella sp.]|nr:PD40 domain-containing protein [Armatimonadota bacterium]